jgi:hypothetical protein
MTRGMAQVLDPAAEQFWPLPCHGPNHRWIVSRVRLAAHHRASTSHPDIENWCVLAPAHLRGIDAAGRHTLFIAIGKLRRRQTRSALLTEQPSAACALASQTSAIYFGLTCWPIARSMACA